APGAQVGGRLIVVTRVAMARFAVREVMHVPLDAPNQHLHHLCPRQAGKGAISRKFEIGCGPCPVDIDHLLDSHVLSSLSLMFWVAHINLCQADAEASAPVKEQMAAVLPPSTPCPSASSCWPCLLLAAAPSGSS